MNNPLVSIVIPHFQTPSLARLCLRSIRRYTTRVPYEAIVVDNNSGDGASLDYLRQVEWIQLIERRQGIAPDPWSAHKEAVDLGIAASRSPYVLAFHTDTIPIRTGWLRWLMNRIDDDPRVAAVGSYKLELKAPWQRALKRLEGWWPLKRQPRFSGGDERPFIRSHCALYRKEVYTQLGLRFVDQTREAAGKKIHFALEANGYQARLIEPDEMLQWVVHLNHGTMVLLPELGAPSRTIRKGNRRIQQFFADPAVQGIYHDASLDRGAHVLQPA